MDPLLHLAKPVHLICNNEQVVTEIQTRFEVLNGARDWTQSEGFHIHVLFRWPVNPERSLSPTREGAVRAWRKSYGCPGCAWRGSNYACPHCGLEFSFRWLATEEYKQNTFNYIARKIEADPLCDIAVPPTEWQGAEAELDAINEANE